MNVYTMFSTATVLAIVLLVSSVHSDHPCGEDCHKEPGKDALFDELAAMGVRPSQFQKDFPKFCDPSTPGTGHGMVLARSLSSSLEISEQCYSLCFSNSDIPGANFSINPFPEVYNLGCSEVYVCLVTCMIRDLEIRELLNLSESATCAELCNIEGGICDVAFPNYDSECTNTCQTELCPLHCNSSFDAPLGSNVTAEDTSNAPLLRYPDDGRLSSLGAVEFSIPGLRPDGVAYGLIWRVQYEENDTTEEYYIPQHLPFILLPGEVGALYRTGSNLLAIQQLQCRQNLRLSYALVSSAGRTNFSQPLLQFFYGNIFPRPPSNITIKYGFDESGELKLQVSVLENSPDHDRVTGYGLQVFTLTTSGQLQFNSDELFPDKDDLVLSINGTSNVMKFMPTYLKETTYYFGVFALPQNRSMIFDGNAYRTASWVQVTTGFPKFPQINGTSCYSVVRDHDSGLSNITIQYHVSTGGRSLAVFSAMTPKLTVGIEIVIPFLNRVQYRPLRSIPGVNSAVKPSKSVYTFEYAGVSPAQTDRMLRFDIDFMRRYNLAPRDGNEEVTFTLKALPPSAVKSLVACYTLNGSSANLTVSWGQPKWLEGNLQFYEIVITLNGQELTPTTTKATQFTDQLTTSLTEASNVSVKVRAKVKPHLYVSVVDGEQSEVYFVVGSAENSNGASCFSTQNGSDEEEDRPEVAVDLCGLYTEEASTGTTPKGETTPTNAAFYAQPSFFVTLSVSLLCLGRVYLAA